VASIAFDFVRSAAEEPFVQFNDTTNDPPAFWTKRGNYFAWNIR
jgi:hypothetical protein